MRYSNVDFTIVYVDPSIVSEGDGSSPDTALKNLPSSASNFEDNTCYLIRRTPVSSTCTIPDGTNYNIANLLIMGMPMASDAMWELMPEEAVTAWGADSEEYANVEFKSTSGSFQVPYIERFLLHRVYLMRDGIDADNYILKFNNSSDYIGCYSLEHCKFGSKGIDVDLSTYTGEITESRLKSYVYIYYAKMVSITDCTINHAVTGNSTNPHGISVYWADVLNVSNVKVFSPAWKYSGQYYPLYLSGTYSKGIECNLSGITQTIRLNGSASHVPMLLYVQGYISMNVRGINVVTGVPLSENKPSSYVVDNAAISFYNVYEMNVDGINASYDDCWNCRYPVLSMSRCYVSTYVPGISKPLKNISVSLARENGIGSEISYSYATQSGEGNAAVVMDFSSGDGDVVAKVPCVDGLSVKCPRGKAFYGSSLRITDAEFEGTVVLECCIADITSISTWFPGKALRAEEGTHVRVRSLTCNIKNPTYTFNEDPAVATTYSDDGNVFVDESNTPLHPMTTLTSKTSHIYQSITCNNEGEEGHFAFRCGNGICDSWSVYREGGGASALKLYNNSYSGMETMVLGRRPFNGMQILPTTTGRQILKAHIAIKGYAKPAELYRNFFLSVQIGERVYYSSLHGRWADDPDSVWVNDSSLTQLVLEMPVDIVEISPVDVRVYFSWYASSGFVYLDPDIQLLGA